ncbi:hypothetical protein Tco_0093060 [Tanacetum coccineum]
MQRTPLHQRFPTQRGRKTLEEAFYTQFGRPFSGGGYRATAPGYYQRNNANPSYQERRQSMEDTLCKFMSESNSTLLYKSRQMTVPFPIRLDNHYCEEEEGNYGPKFAKAYGALHIKDTIPRKEKDLGRLGELARTRLTVELADKTVKYPKTIAEMYQTFSVMTDLAVLEDMDAYHDEGMGNVIFGEPFLREVGIKVRRFEGMITIYNDNDEVTYQMVRSHPRFKHHTNEQCNQIPPLLKVSDEDKKNRISHPYQKPKGFYKGVLNLGPDYIRDARTEEWLTRRHISVHKM